MSKSEVRNANERLEPTNLTLETAKEISELLEDGKSLKEIGKAISRHGHSINAWITGSLLSNDIDSALSTLRNAILERVLKGTVILGMLKAAEHPSEKITRKSVILTELSKQDKALLEREGYESFIEQTKDKIILKVEETVETIPPQTNLYKEVLKAAGDGKVEVSQKITPFPEPHPDCPPV